MSCQTLQQMSTDLFLLLSTCSRLSSRSSIVFITTIIHPRCFHLNLDSWLSDHKGPFGWCSCWLWSAIFFFFYGVWICWGRKVGRFFPMWCFAFHLNSGAMSRVVCTQPVRHSRGMSFELPDPLSVRRRSEEPGCLGGGGTSLPWSPADDPRGKPHHLNQVATLW